MRMKLNASLLLASAAVAVGLGMTRASAQGVGGSHDWNGFYAGANVGAGFASQPWDDIVVPSNTDYGRAGRIGETNPNAFVGGGQVGWNYQMDNWVFGVEASFDGGNSGGSFQCFGGDDGYYATCGTSSQWNADFTGRVGAVLNGVLFYAKAGGELRDLTAHARDVRENCCSRENVGSFGDSHSTPFGWVVGGGAEFWLCDDLTGALEYDYSEVDAVADFVPLPDATADIFIPFNVKVAQRTSTVTFRVNYHID